MSTDNTKVKWNALIDAIEQEKCILCIGPGVFTNEEGIKLEDQLLAYLKAKGELDDDIICYPDGLFYFKVGSKRDIVVDFKHFYKGDFPYLDKLYRKLVKIPFSLILFLTPDERYVEIAKEEGLPIHSDFYFKEEPSRIKEAPSKSFPIAYNLFGSFRDDASIIMTYDDLFDFMQSILTGTRMSANMHNTIRQAKHFICLGLPFDKWYMQLLLRVLGIHNIKRLTKYAANINDQESDIISFFEKQFDMTFVGAKADSFVEEMYKLCEEDDLLRLPAATHKSTKERVRDLIANDKLQEGVEVIKTSLRQENRLDERLEDQIAHIKRRLKANKIDRIKNVIKDEDYRQERSRLTDSILILLNDNF